MIFTITILFLSLADLFIVDRKIKAQTELDNFLAAEKTSKDREDTIEFMNMTEYIDLIVPRGGRGLIDTLVNNSKVPFILDGDGNVHLYIHEDAKEEYMVPIVINSKVQRPGVCSKTQFPVYPRTQ